MILDYREIKVRKEREEILVFRDRRVNRVRRVAKGKEVTMVLRVTKEKEEILEYREKMV